MFSMSSLLRSFALFFPLDFYYDKFCVIFALFSASSLAFAAAAALAAVAAYAMASSFFFSICDFNSTTFLSRSF
jgi:hypothetical protein